MVDRETTGIPGLPALVRLPLTSPSFGIEPKNGKRQAFQDSLVALAKVDVEATQEETAELVEANPFPPPVNGYNAIVANLHSGFASEVAIGVIIDGCVVHWPTAGVLHGGVDRNEVRVKGFLVFLADPLGVCRGQRSQLTEDLWGVMVWFVSLDESRAFVVEKGFLILVLVVFLGLFGLIILVVVLLVLTKVGSGTEALFVEKGDVLAGGNLHTGVVTTQLLGKDFDRLLTFSREVPDVGRQVAPL